MNSKRRQYSFLMLVIMLLTAAFGQNAFALAQLRLSDGTTTITITDAGPGDVNPNPGVITFIGPVGPNWTFNATAGISKPLVGSPAAPYMDVGTTSISSQNNGILTVEFTDTDFLASGVAIANFGATVPGDATVSYKAWMDPANSPFAKSTLITSIGPIGGAPSDTANGVVTAAGPYSLTLQTVVNHPTPGQTHFDSEFFIEPCTGRIGDFVWHDLNGNGCQDPGEPGIENVEVVLYRGACGGPRTSIATNKTDNTGHYLFSGLCAGDYQVEITTPAGFGATKPLQACAFNGADPSSNQTNSKCNCAGASPCVICVTLAANNSVNLNIDCGYVKPTANCAVINNAVQGVQLSTAPLTGSGGCAGTYTFSDSGTLPAALIMAADGSISGIPNASGDFNYQVTVTDSCGNTGTIACSVRVNPPPSASCVNVNAVQGVPVNTPPLTGSGGCGAPYKFEASGLPANLVMADDGSISGIPTMSGVFDYTVTVRDKCGNPGSAGKCQVTVQCVGQIGNFIWHDLNGNGCQDPNEPGIQNVKVVLYSGVCGGPGTPIATNMTDNTGHYLFSGLCLGVYQVEITTPVGFAPTKAKIATCGTAPGLPPDRNELNSKCECGATSPCVICGVTLTAANPVNLNIDCGYVRPPKADCLTINAVQGVNISVGPMVGSGGCGGPYTFSASGTLPAALTMAADGTISGIPNASGTFPYTVTVTDICGNTGTVNCSVTVTSSKPCLKMTKTANKAVIAPYEPVIYSYEVCNCGGTPLTNIVVTDDNGTPNTTSDDFTVGTIGSLAAGACQTLTATVIPVVSTTAIVNGTIIPAGSVIVVTTLAGGDIKITYLQSFGINDNTYGTGAIGWPSGHTFGNLTGSDKLEFRLFAMNGSKVLDFYLDTISAAPSVTTANGLVIGYPSGYGTLGPFGGDGSMVFGDPKNIVSFSTSISDNLNKAANLPNKAALIVNSPTSLVGTNVVIDPLKAPGGWDHINSYTVVVKGSAFAAGGGFGAVAVPDQHNSPNKLNGPHGFVANSTNSIVMNTATAKANTLTATAKATVTIVVPVPPPTPCNITPGTLKFYKKTVQLPLKNNGSADILLSELTLSWPQSVNGNLVKVSLNGDAWIGSASSPKTLTVANFVADASKRKITPGQTKTLTLTFVNNASPNTALYSGTIKFGDGASCQIAFPPPTPPAPFDCDGHIRELKMRWNGTEPIKVVAHYGSTISTATIATIDNVAVGQVVTVSGYTGSPNDVVWEIFKAGTNIKIGESQFHTSCSDSTMDGPEDCGSAQGNGKNNVATYLNLWKFVGLTTIKGTTLLCP